MSKAPHVKPTCGPPRFVYEAHARATRTMSTSLHNAGLAKPRPSRGLTSASILKAPLNPNPSTLPASTKKAIGGTSLVRKNWFSPIRSASVKGSKMSHPSK